MLLNNFYLLLRCQLSILRLEHNLWSVSMSIQKFSLPATKDVKEYYDVHGYVVIENLLNPTKIDHFFETYEAIKHNPFFIYYSQSIHTPLRPKITAEGYIQESMQNATQLKFFPRFSGAMLNCLVDTNISVVLSMLSGESSHAMYQNMFFDKSTGTIEHQDHYYLDTDPPGHLIGTWYALEDIHPEAGCFFVLPGSHLGAVIERENMPHSKGVAARFADHDAMMDRIRQLVQNNLYEYKTFPLCKGDVLFWHPYTIHGAHSCANPRYSRKSFTAHYGPTRMHRLYTQSSPTLQPSSNPDILIDQQGTHLYWSNLKLYIKYILDKASHRSEAFMDMRRQSYKTE
jgi:phytanoyl-CoA hydroxylase